jgi:hypothetical protein
VKIIAKFSTSAAVNPATARKHSPDGTQPETFSQLTVETIDTSQSTEPNHHPRNRWNPDFEETIVLLHA